MVIGGDIIVVFEGAGDLLDVVSITEIAEFAGDTFKGRASFFRGRAGGGAGWQVGRRGRRLLARYLRFVGGLGEWLLCGGGILLAAAAAAPAGRRSSVGGVEADARVCASLAAAKSLCLGLEVVGSCHVDALFNDTIRCAQVNVDDFTDHGPAVQIVFPFTLIFQGTEDLLAVRFDGGNVAKESGPV